MAVLVIADHDGSAVRDTTAKTVTAAQKLGGDIDILVVGQWAKAAADSAAQISGVRKVLLAESAELGKTLPFDSLMELRRAMFAEVPHLGRIDEVPENAWTPVGAGPMSGEAFGSAVADHYLANPIMRASQVMAELSRLAAGRHQALAAE